MHAPLKSHLATSGFCFNRDARKVDVELSYDYTGTRATVGEHRFLMSGRVWLNGEVLVCIDAGLPPGTELRPDLRPLWAGIVGATIVARNVLCFLVKLKPGEPVTVFYADGNVAEFKLLDDATAVRVCLDPAAAFEARLRLVDENFAKAVSDAKRRERTFGELASMLRMSSVMPHFHEAIIRKIGHHAKYSAQGSLSNKEKSMLRGALLSIGDREPRWWLGGNTGQPSSSASVALARKHQGKAERRVRDAEERRKMRGPTGSKPNPGLEARQRREAEANRKAKGK